MKKEDIVQCLTFEISINSHLLPNRKVNSLPRCLIEWQGRFMHASA